MNGRFSNGMFCQEPGISFNRQTPPGLGVSFNQSDTIGPDNSTVFASQEMETLDQIMRIASGLRSELVLAIAEYLGVSLNDNHVYKTCRMIEHATTDLDAMSIAGLIFGKGQYGNVWAASVQNRRKDVFALIGMNALLTQSDPDRKSRAVAEDLHTSRVDLQAAKITIEYLEGELAKYKAALEEKSENPTVAKPELPADNWLFDKVDGSSDQPFRDPIASLTQLVVRGEYDQAKELAEQIEKVFIGLTNSAISKQTDENQLVAKVHQDILKDWIETGDKYLANAADETNPRDVALKETLSVVRGAKKVPGLAMLIGCTMQGLVRKGMLVEKPSAVAAVTATKETQPENLQTTEQQLAVSKPRKPRVPRKPAVKE